MPVRRLVHRQKSHNLCESEEDPMRVETELKELGLTLPTPPQPVAAYLPAVQAGDLLFLSYLHINGSGNT